MKVLILGTLCLAAAVQLATARVDQCQCNQLKQCVQDRKNVAERCTTNCKNQLTSSRAAIDTCEEEKRRAKAAKASKSRNRPSQKNAVFQKLGMCGSESFQGKPKTDETGESGGSSTSGGRSGLRGRLRGRPGTKKITTPKGPPSYLPQDIRDYITCIKQCKKNTNRDNIDTKEWLCPDSPLPDQIFVKQRDQSKKGKEGKPKKKRGSALNKMLNEWWCPDSPLPDQMFVKQRDQAKKGKEGKPKKKRGSALNKVANCAMKKK